MNIPHVHKVVNLLFEDQALLPPVDYKLPKWFDNIRDGETIFWPKVEKFLAALNEDDFITFCIGDEEEQHAIRDRDPNGEYAHHAVDTLFLVMVAEEE